MTEQIDNETPEQENIDNKNVVEETPVEDEANQPENEETTGDTFPRDYVEKLRAENAENRVKAKRADDLAHRLHEALTAATGRLQDPRDLHFDETHLDDPEALTTAIDSLLEDRPHLASRRVSGDIGQGTTDSKSNTVNLAGMLKGNL